VESSSWTTEAEAVIRTLRDVDDVNIRTEGDVVREIHILSTSARPAKQIVRDVQTLLLTRFKRSIDHRVVSVAFLKEPSPARAPQPPPAAAPRSSAIEAAPESVEEPERIRFMGANVYVSGQRVQAQVELQWKGMPRMGSASGWSTRDGAHRLLAAATAAAVQEYLEDGLALSVEGVEIVRLGHREVAVVAMELLAHRDRKTLVGCCSTERDTQQAVALAALDALNRVVGGLRCKEPTEYVLRPASTKEASEAK